MGSGKGQTKRVNSISPSKNVNSEAKNHKLVTLILNDNKFTGAFSSALKQVANKNIGSQTWANYYLGNKGQKIASEDQAAYVLNEYLKDIISLLQDNSPNGNVYPNSFEKELVYKSPEWQQVDLDNLKILRENNSYYLVDTKTKEVINSYKTNAKMPLSQKGSTYKVRGGSVTAVMYHLTWPDYFTDPFLKSKAPDLDKNLI